MRLVSIVIALALAALPLAARADFYLNLKVLAQQPSVYGQGECAGFHQRFRQEMTCGGAGSFTIDRWVSGGCGNHTQKNCAPAVYRKCILSVWNSGGPASKTWHADFSRNDEKNCSMHWDNGNTLTVTVR